MLHCAKVEHGVEACDSSISFTAGAGSMQRGQAVPGPDAEALVLPRPGDGTAGTLQRSASAGALLLDMPSRLDDEHRSAGRGCDTMHPCTAC